MATAAPSSPCSNSNDSGNTAFNYGDITDDSISVYDDQIITTKMKEEEERLANEAALEEERMKKEYEELVKKEEKEQRYKRLMHLLMKSQFFSDYLMKKLDENEKNQKRGKKPKAKTETKALAEINSNVTVSDNNNLSISISTSEPVVVDLDSDDANAISEKHGKDKPVADIESAPSDRLSLRKRKPNVLFYKDNYNIKEVISKEELEKVKKARLVSNENQDKNLESKASKTVTSENAEPDEAELPKTKITGLGLEVSVDQPDLLEGGVLRDYQLQGVDWLKLLYENGMNGILADEMGLGKTIQLIAHICFLISKGIRGPYLIVAPLSTLSNWIMEFEKFAPQIPVILFHGSQAEREKIYPLVQKYHKIGNLTTTPVLITSYEVPLKEKRFMSHFLWEYIIVDEGHRIKNANSNLSRVLRSLRSKNRLLLTGTPLQNNLTELWSLLNFLLPELFDDLSTFESWFDIEEMNRADAAEKIIQQEQESKIISTLHQILCPFLMRRTKADVVINIPPKKEVMVYCPMTPLQIEMYKAVVDNSIASLLFQESADKPRAKRKSTSTYRADSVVPDSPPLYSFNVKTNEVFPLDKMPLTKELTERVCPPSLADSCGFTTRLKMQNPPMVLKHIVNHPYIVRMPVNYIRKSFGYQCTKELRVTEDLKTVSGKLLVLDAMLTKLKQRNHKVLIFCTSCMMLDLLEEHLIMAKHRYVRLDGSTKLLSRKEDIYAFNTDPDLFVYLLATRAGGLGINLTGADTVILYDSDWNPQVDLQAQDRVHRIGQTKPVVVYRFNVAGTVADRVICRASSKRKLEKIVMAKGAFDLGVKRRNELMNLQELRDLLETTDFQKEMHSNGFVFTDEELDELLDRSDLMDAKPIEDKEKVTLSSPKGKSKNTTPKKKVYEVIKIDRE